MKVRPEKDLTDQNRLTCYFGIVRNTDSTGRVGCCGYFSGTSSSMVVLVCIKKVAVLAKQHVDFFKKIFNHEIYE